MVCLSTSPWTQTYTVLEIAMQALTPPLVWGTRIRRPQTTRGQWPSEADVYTSALCMTACKDSRRPAPSQACSLLFALQLPAMTLCGAAHYWPCICLVPVICACSAASQNSWSLPWLPLLLAARWRPTQLPSRSCRPSQTTMATRSVQRLLPCTAAARTYRARHQPQHNCDYPSLPLDLRRTSHGQHCFSVHAVSGLPSGHL